MPESLEDQQALYRALVEDAPTNSGELFSYHSRDAVWNCSTRTNHRFGFEAEKEDEYGQHLAEIYQGEMEFDLPFN